MKNYLYICPDQASHVVAGRVKTNIDGIRRLSTPFVRSAKGKGRFLNVTVCILKSRKFESMYSGNATKRLRGCIISRPFRCYHNILMVTSVPTYIISLGVGWLALLILTWGQCESLSIGVGTEELTPTSFLFPGT